MCWPALLAAGKIGRRDVVENEGPPMAQHDPCPARSKSRAYLSGEPLGLLPGILFGIFVVVNLIK